MEDEYMIFESKMNHLTLEELDKIDPDTSNILIERIIEWQNKANTDDIKRLNRVAELLSISTEENALQQVKRLKGIYFDTVLNRYRAKRVIKGVKYLIKTSKNLKEVESALIEFCDRYKLYY